MTYARDRIELLGTTYPARKDGKRFFVPVDFPASRLQRIYHDGMPLLITEIKRTPHATILRTERER